MSEGSLTYALMGFDNNYSDLYVIEGTSQPQLLVSNGEGNLTGRRFSGELAIRTGIVYIS